MTISIRLLSIEDSKDDDVLIRRELTRAGIILSAHKRVFTLPDLDAALEEPWDICICDFNLPTFHALTALERIGRRRELDLPTLVVTGSVDDDVAKAVYTAGARDLIGKNRLARLGPAIERELKERQGRAEKVRLSSMLHEAQERFGSIMKYMPALVFLKDGAGKFVYANEAFLAFSGREAWQVFGRDDAEIFDAAAAERLRDLTRRVRAGTTALPLEERLVDAHGRERSLSGVAFPLGPKSDVVAGVAFDVTDRVRAEHALRASEDRFRAVADAAGDAMLTVDSAGAIRYGNVAAARMFGRTVEALQASRFIELMAPSSAFEHGVHFARLIAHPDLGPIPWTSEIETLAGDGSTIPTELSVGGWEWDGHRFVTAIFRDLRARRALEAQLRQAQKMEAIGQLAGGIAHDFNNILGIITNYLEFIGEAVSASASGVREDLDQIRIAVDRGATLVRQLLEFSRKRTVRMEAVPLGEVVEDLEKMLRRAAGATIDVTLDVAADLPLILADRGQMEQVLVNLVVNARDAIHERGGIVVSAKAEGSDVVLRVRDDGCGMDEATKMRVFEPFFTTKPVGKGTGLGLATVYGIVQQVHGKISIDSEVGAGTTFEIRIPALDAAASRRSLGPNRASSPGHRLREPGAVGAQDLVLVVEAEPMLAGAFGRCLRSVGFRVVELDRAEQAVALLDALGGAVAAVVTDASLPTMSATALARAARPRAPVVLVGGTSGDAVPPAELGDTIVLEKPVSSETLCTSVRQAIDGRRRRKE